MPGAFDKALPEGEPQRHRDTERKDRRKIGRVRDLALLVLAISFVPPLCVSVPLWLKHLRRDEPAATSPTLSEVSAMLADNLARDLYAALCDIPLIDPHSHIDPHHPTAKSLDDILGYHYYTELAHSAGMSQGPLAPNVSPRERVR